MLVVAFALTVALLVWMGFFMMGSLPLLILKHDTPLDARFIRGLFHVYYVAVVPTGAIGALAYAAAGRLAIASTLGGIAVAGLAARRWFIPRMDRLRSTMTADDTVSIRRFRVLHVGGMLLNVLLLAVLCVGMAKA